MNSIRQFLAHSVGRAGTKRLCLSLFGLTAALVLSISVLPDAMAVGLGSSGGHSSGGHSSGSHSSGGSYHSSGHYGGGGGGYGSGYGNYSNNYSNSYGNGYGYGNGAYANYNGYPPGYDPGHPVQTGASFSGPSHIDSTQYHYFVQEYNWPTTAAGSTSAASTTQEPRNASGTTYGVQSEPRASGLHLK